MTPADVETAFAARYAALPKRKDGKPDMRYTICQDTLLALQAWLLRGMGGAIH